MADHHEIAVVILNWNGAALLKQFLPSVIENSKEHATIFVVDNGSTDDSLEILKSEFPSVKVIENEHNLGFADGYNKALKEIKTDYYVLLNSDVEVTANWLRPMLEHLEQHPAIAACQPKVINYNKRNQFDYAGAAGGLLDKYGYPFCRGRLFHHMEDDTQQYNTAIDIFWASGACFFLRSEAYHQVNGLDSDFHAHMEEIDLCWRLQNAGHRISVVPASVVFHVGGSSLQYGSYRKVFLNYRNNMVMLYKNLSKEKVFTTIFTRLILDCIAAIRALLAGKVNEFFAICAAHWNFFSHLGKWKKARKQAQQQSDNSKLSGWYNRSIVFDVFLRGKKKFSELDLDQLN